MQAEAHLTQLRSQRAAHYDFPKLLSSKRDGFDPASLIDRGGSVFYKRLTVNQTAQAFADCCAFKPVNTGENAANSVNWTRFQSFGLRAVFRRLWL